MTPPTIIDKVALAVFRDGAMLMVRTSKNAEVFYTLGGKVEPGETDIQALHREVKEEAGADIKQGTVTFLHEFQAPAYGRENTLVNIKLYQGELLQDPIPSSEVVEIRYFDSTIADRHLSDVTRLIFQWLKEQSLVS